MVKSLKTRSSRKLACEFIQVECRLGCLGEINIKTCNSAALPGSLYNIHVCHHQTLIIWGEKVTFEGSGLRFLPRLCVAGWKQGVILLWMLNNNFISILFNFFYVFTK